MDKFGRWRRMDYKFLGLGQWYNNPNIMRMGRSFFGSGAVLMRTRTIRDRRSPIGMRGSRTYTSYSYCIRNFCFG